METYTCTVKLNITNGFGNTVLSSIQEANIPDMINAELKPHGSVIETKEKWDSGIISHDLYLTYVMNIHSYRLVKSNSCKLAAKMLKFSGFLNSTICNNIQSSINNGFQEKLSGPLKNLAVVLSSCNVV